MNVSMLFLSLPVCVCQANALVYFTASRYERKQSLNYATSNLRAYIRLTLRPRPRL